MNYNVLTWCYKNIENCELNDDKGEDCVEQRNHHSGGKKAKHQISRSERKTNRNNIESLQKRVEDDDVVEVKKERAPKKEKREKQTEEEKELRKEKKLIKKRVSWNKICIWQQKSNEFSLTGSRRASTTREASQGRRQNNQNFPSQWRRRWANSTSC